MTHQAKDPSLPRASYTTEEAIVVSGFNRNRLYTLIAEGKLKTFCHGRRRFVSAAALAACIRELERATEHADAPAVSGVVKARHFGNVAEVRGY